MANYLLVFGVLAALSSAAFAEQCMETYNQCLAGCCDQCGGELTSNGNGQYFCEGPEGARQGCVNACLSCAHDYQQCTDGGSPAASPPSSSSGSDDYSANVNCCGSAVILGAVLGMAVIRRK